MFLSDSQQQFFPPRSEKSSRCDISRSMDQKSTFLYHSPAPLNATLTGEIFPPPSTNFSTTLRELLAWSIVRLNHRLGDKRSLFKNVTDVRSFKKKGK